MMLSGIEYRSSRTEEPFQELNKKSVALKRILARIPEEISDRKTFLETIKWVFRNFFDISPLPSFTNWNIFQLMFKFHLCFETKNHKNTSTKNAHFIKKQLWWARMKNLKHLIHRWDTSTSETISDDCFSLDNWISSLFFREIASAIKKLLDAVNEVSAYIPGTSGKQALDQKKREFVKYSKRFSNTLKEFFRDGQ